MGIFILNGCNSTNAPTKYQVNISAKPSNGGTVSPSGGEYKAGTKIEISATPAQGWKFVGWQGDYNGNSSSATITVDSDMDIVGMFEKKNYPLTINIEGHGSVDEQVVGAKSTDYPYNTKVELTAKPDKGWKFVKWKGDINSSNNPITITVDKSKTVTAVFEKKNYPLTVKIDGQGTVSEKVIQAKTTDYPYNTKVQLTANPAKGWKFVKWTGDLSGSKNPETITVDKAKTVTAVFKKKSFTLTVKTEGKGTVTKNPN